LSTSNSKELGEYQKLNQDMDSESHRSPGNSKVHVDLEADSFAGQIPKDARLFNVWPAFNRFYCGGKVLTGPTRDMPLNICVWCTLLAISGVFFGVAAPTLWVNNSPAIPVLCAVMLIVTCTFLIMTSCMDPGIIPRKYIFESLAIEEPVQFTDKAQFKSTNGVITKGTLCSTCKIYRPPRASHCSACNNCVEIFDHHCPFVNNCVGKRNYKYFIGFIGSLTLLAGCYFAGVILIIVQSANSGDSSSSAYVVISILIGIPIVLTALCLFGFTCFHFSLICSGKTTREKLKNIDAQYIDHNEESSGFTNSDPPVIDPRRKINSGEYVRLYKLREEEIAERKRNKQNNNTSFE
jgi:hypothetical protein